MAVTIDLTPFEKALRQLKRALVRAHADLNDEELRDACIQRFEYTYELAWKMLKRQLEIEIANTTEVDSFSKKQLFRVGGERGLVQNVEAWFEYLEKRNITSHTYDAAKAHEVFIVLDAFEKDAADLCSKLQARRNA